MDGFGTIRYVFSMSVRGADKEIKKYVLDEDGYTWLGTEYKRKSRKYPRTIQVTSQTGRKLKKTVHEKQVVFWSEKYAKRAKADRAAALVKAADLAKNPGSYTRPVYVWTREHIEAHFLTCFVALTIARILETKLKQKYSIGKLLESLSKASCTLIQQNYYLFDYYDDMLKDIGNSLDIDFSEK